MKCTNCGLECDEVYSFVKIEHGVASEETLCSNCIVMQNRGVGGPMSVDLVNAKCDLCGAPACSVEETLVDGERVRRILCEKCSLLR